MFKLVRVRSAGELLPRYRLAFVDAPIGDLVVCEQYRSDLHRHTMVARLAHPSSGAFYENVPPLYDATLLKWDKCVVILAGIERIQDEKGLREFDVAQTWVLYEVGAE